MKKLVIIPGGFHPFHPGHLDLYHNAEKYFPGADVYVAATADTSERPFPFDVKKKLAQLAGIPKDRFVQVKSPFRAQEIVSQFDPKNTQLIFVRSDKDRNSQPQPGGTKKDGSPSYLQPYTERESLPMSDRGYMAYLPTKEFLPGIQDASKIRAEWPQLDQRAKLDRVKSLYPKTKKNEKLANNVVRMLDLVLNKTVDENQGWAATLETTLVNDPERGMQIRPEGGMGTWNEASLVRNLAEKFQSSAQMLRAGDYGSLYYNLYGSSATRALVKALADLEQFQQKQGNRPLATGREIQVGEEMAGTPAVGGMQATYQARENQPNLDFMDEGHT
jgi:hypothetical protein